MLVLSRGVDEAITIVTPEGRRITVTVVSIVGHNKVRLGFEADPDVEIDRYEVRWEKDRALEVASGQR